jgi:hypothetical protein
VVGVLANGSSWEDRASGFEEARYPLLLDPMGAIFYLYGTESYELILIDRKLRLVEKKIFTDSALPAVKQRLRELHAE